MCKEKLDRIWTYSAMHTTVIGDDEFVTSTEHAMELVVSKLFFIFLLTLDETRFCLLGCMNSEIVALSPPNKRDVIKLFL